ncbi:MAG: hypothetical protein HYX67_05410 [Candidatus Melainabacteria bacterium]|nr:hypothetical protein [Candidatus Melainabacteria bacterium]
MHLICFKRLWLAASLAIFVSSLSVQYAVAVDVDSSIDAVFQHYDISKTVDGQDVAQKKKADRSFTYTTELTVPQGHSYLIITDTGAEYAASINKLAQAHDGKVIRLDDFRTLITDPRAKAKLIADIAKAQPEFVALAPRLENFSENVTLALWEVLSEYGGGPINVYPAFMVAPNPSSFAKLVAHSLSGESLPASSLNAFIVGQSTVASAGGARAVQKAQVVKSLISRLHGASNSVIVKTNENIEDLPAQSEPSVTTLDGDGKRVMAITPDLQSKLANSNLMVLFGHGSPGMTCSLDVSAFRSVPLDNQIVLCGSCFSATPDNSDLPSIAQTNGKHSATFYHRAIENGARVFYWHMHENGGFPEMFVVLNSLLHGETVGQSYQRLLNVQLKDTKVPENRWVMTPEQLANKVAIDRRNGLLYIMVGDPAAKPISVH